MQRRGAGGGVWPERLERWGVAGRRRGTGKAGDVGPSQAGKGLEHHWLWGPRASWIHCSCLRVAHLQNGHTNWIFFMEFP